MNQDLVRQYYASFAEREWLRLETPEGIVEWCVTTDAISRHLRQPSGVLDVGGGPGRYAIWLAQQGHRVTLVDLAPNLLDIARQRIAEAGVGDAIDDVAVRDVCDLSAYAGASFDAVVCLGPFYHLMDAAQRQAAAGEVARVLKPGGTAFFALMPRFGFLRRTLAAPDERRHLTDANFVRRLMDEGIFLNDVPGRFNAGYGVQPEEVAPFFESNGFETIEMLSDAGFAAGLTPYLAEIAQSEPEVYESALRLIADTASDPSLWGTANHLVYVGRRRLEP